MSEGRRHYQPGALIPGTVYQVRKYLGGGGMGSVYDVEDTTVGKRFVLKTLHAELGNREDLVRRLLFEARALAQLLHPNIVDVFTAGVTTDELRLPYYVMERLTGQNLRLILSKRGSLDLPHALHIGIDLLDALQSAHDIQVFHRDIKPDNIFLHRGVNNITVTKLLDFGIARDSSSPSTTGDKFVGTLRYAAPEQLQENRSSAQSDIYSAALVIFEMVAGRGPFDDASNVGEIARAHIKRPAPSLADLGVRAPPELEMALKSALAKDPTKRPKDAFTFASYLRNLKSREERPGFSNDSRPTAVALISGLDTSSPSTPLVPVAAPPATPDGADASSDVPTNVVPKDPPRAPVARATVPMPNAAAYAATMDAATMDAATRASTPEAKAPAPPQGMPSAEAPTSPPAPAPASMPQPFTLASPGHAGSVAAPRPAAREPTHAPTHEMALPVDRGAVTQTVVRPLPASGYGPAHSVDIREVAPGGSPAVDAMGIRDTVRQTAPGGARADVVDAAMQIRAAMGQVPLPGPVAGSASVPVPVSLPGQVPMPVPLDARTEVPSVSNVLPKPRGAQARAILVGVLAAATLTAAAAVTVELLFRTRMHRAESPSPAAAPEPTSLASPTLATPLFDEVPSAVPAANAAPPPGEAQAAPPPGPAGIAGTKPSPVMPGGTPASTVAQAHRGAPASSPPHAAVALPPELDVQGTMPSDPAAASAAPKKRLSGL